MAEFQVGRTHAFTLKINILVLLLSSDILSSHLKFIFLQTLRETIHQEYREVVERRVYTGLSIIITNLWLLNLKLSLT